MNIWDFLYSFEFIMMLVGSIIGFIIVLYIGIEDKDKEEGEDIIYTGIIIFSILIILTIYFYNRFWKNKRIRRASGKAVIIDWLFDLFFWIK